MTSEHITTEQTRFNLLTLVAHLPRRSGQRYSLFRCDCGNEVERNYSHVKNGISKACRSCIVTGRHATHGHCVGGKSTQTYDCWSSMWKRCSNPSHASYKDYGGRGITVCDRWASFENFLADMGEKPARLSIDRFPDADGPYEPSNCRWATMREQNNNKRGNTVIEYEGVKITISEWSASIGIKDCTLSERLRRGWSVEKSLTTPTMNRGKRPQVS